MGADAVHHLYLGTLHHFVSSMSIDGFVIHTGDYKREYPNAKLIAPKDAIERHGDNTLKFDGGNYLITPCFTL